MLLSLSLLVALLGPDASAQAGARPISPVYDGNCQGPVWSRNGARLAYEVNDHLAKTIDLFVYTPGAGEPRRVRPVTRGKSSLTQGFQTSTEQVAHEVSWGPAFIDRFVYSATDSARDQDLYLDGAGALAPSPGADGGAAWSPDGRWIAFTSARTGQGDLYLLDAHQIDQAPRRLTNVADGSELYPTWSPDGTRLAFVAHSDKGDGIWLIEDLSTGSARQLFSFGHTQTRPSFSPDGKRLAFYSNHVVQDRFDLYLHELASPAPPTLLAEGVVLNHRGPSWTPDGRSIVYVRDDNDAFDPIWSVRIADPSSRSVLATQTVGNGDLDLVLGTDGKVWLAVSAQGKVQDKIREFKRIYVMAVP